MGLRLAVLLSAFFLISSQISSAEKDNRLIKDIEIKLKAAEAPRFASENASSSGSTSKSKWLCIDVNYVLPDITGKGSGDIEWLDDMEVIYEVLYPSMYKGRNIYVRFTGKTIYWSVPMDNKKHKADAYVPPQILGRYGRPDTKSGDFLKSVEVRVTFYDKNSRPLGRAYYPKGDKQTVANFNKADEMTSPVPKIENTVYPRNKTPWSVLDFDSCELIKTLDSGKK